MKPEEVWDRADIVFTFDNDNLRQLISLAYALIPDDTIVEWLLENCYAVLQEEGGVYISAALLKDKSVLFFSSEILNDPLDEAIRLILHESAHAYLRHSCPLEWDVRDLPQPQWDAKYAAQEAEAWAKVAEWLG